MTISNLGVWVILAIISAIGLIIFWRKQNAVWGGLTLGAIIGLIIAVFYVFKGNGFSWSIIGKGVIIGTLTGIIAALLGIISDRFKRKKQ